MVTRRSKGGVALVLFVACLACYCLTLAPTITWQHDGVDSGDLVTAAYTLGIAHPPGYPLFTLLAKLFTFLPIGEIAYRVNLMSALLAAAAVSVVFCIILLLRPERIDTPSMVVIAAASALLLAFSRVFWSQAIIAEVYSLNALLVALIILFTTLYWRRAETRWLHALATVFGLGLSNHFSCLLLLPGVLLLVLRKGRLRGTICLRLAVLFLAGLSAYLYLPLSSARIPPLDWGGPHTWSGFWWTVSAKIYQEYAFGLPAAHLPARLATWLSMSAEQFTWIGFALGLAGIWDLWEEEREWLLFSLTSFGAVAVYSITYNTTDSYVYLLPSYLLFAMWMARGASYLLRDAIIPWINKGRDRVSTTSRPLWLLSLPLLLLPVFILSANLRDLDLSNDREAYEYAATVFAQVPADAVIIAGTDAHVFSLWYLLYVQGAAPHAAVVAEGLFQYQWYKDTLLRNHPQLAVPRSTADPYDQLFAFIDANLPRHPVFLTDSDDRILDCYQSSQVGTLYRLGVKG
jgi:hypothetical protein